MYNDNSKNYSNNSLFLDIINKINIDAKAKGYINGKEWLGEAQRAGEVSPQDFNKFQSCHYLRNIIAHGGGVQLIITDESINVAQAFLAKITVSNVYRIKPTATPSTVTTTPVVMHSAAPVEPEGPKLGDVKKKFDRLKVINDPANAQMVEHKKSLAEGLRSFKEYAKTPKAELEQIVIEMLCSCSDEEFKELQKVVVKPVQVVAPAVPTPPPSTIEIKQTIIKNLMNVYDQTTRKVVKDLGFMVKKRYLKDASDIFEAAKKEILAAKNKKEMEAIYSKATENLLTLEPQIKLK